MISYPPELSNRFAKIPIMSTDLDTVIQKVDRLEIQNRRLRFFTFGVWPATLAIITILILLPGKVDLKAMKYLLGFIGGTFGVLMLVLAIAMACWFMLKLAVDFKNRNSRFVLNPGSRQTSGVSSSLAEQVVTTNGG
jgi:hypothetical protein